MNVCIVLCLILLVQCSVSQDLSDVEFVEVGNKGEVQPDEDDGRIVGGYPTTIDRHPYQVSLRYKGRHRCGGAIISDEWIITAAHCVKGVVDSYLKVKAGSTLVNGRGQVSRVRRVFIHDNYSSRSSDFDIAIIRLERRLLFNRRVSPINLPEPDDIFSSGDRVLVTGWGATESSGPSSDQLRAVEVPLVSSHQCQEQYTTRRITLRMICAGFIGKGGKDACQGDSGGPLVQGGKLVGIVSWGYGCAEPSYPGVYTRITALRSWISEITDL
ncbi:hypothetical protein QAD02_009534 [Eretmocerus hayati]|uniref:Uncharacterized protein n=1 Tax=Eretmocerus hayati TaxID=131215 RepID=A0ACC2NAY7_9HYME|nr:hypothetical protein QAD02_009534 [Eretmocerus hayati]